MIKVAAVLIERNGKLLICQREEGGNCSLLWEFPGGKQELGETMEQCLVRECREELGVEIEVLGLYEETSYRYGDKEFFFAFYRARIVSGEVEKRVHHSICWEDFDQLNRYDFCPADQDLIAKLSVNGNLD